MGIKVEKFFTLTDTDGVSHRLPMTQRIPASNDVRIVCDSAKCALRHNKDEAAELVFTEEEAAKDPLAAVPDGFFRIINVEFERGREPKTFCSALCVSDYLTYEYVMPLSPREQEEQRQRNEAVEAKKRVQLVDSNEDGA